MNENKEVNVTLTLSQVKNVAEFIEFNLLESIRNDDEIDNIRWVADMCEAYKKLIDILEKGKKEG